MRPRWASTQCSGFTVVICSSSRLYFEESAHKYKLKSWPALRVTQQGENPYLANRVEVGDTASASTFPLCPTKLTTS
jgi:hypothetical protein